MVEYRLCARPVVSFAGADLSAELVVSVAEPLAQICSTFGWLEGAEYRVEARPFGCQRGILVFELSAHNTNCVRCDARVKRLRTVERGGELVEEVLDGRQQLIGGGAILHGAIIRINARTVARLVAFC